VEAPLVLMLNDCALGFDIQGSAAVIRPGQVCPPTMGQSSDGTPFTATGTHNSAVFSVAGSTANFSDSGTLTVVTTAGQTVPCIFSEIATLIRATP
jgi:hypothetical protein